MKQAQMNISHFRFILFNLKIFGVIVTTFLNLELPGIAVSAPTFKLFEY